MGITTGLATSPDDLRIAFDDAGRGDPPVVLVHGWSCDRTYWRHVVPALADGHRVIAVDLPGHGDSDLGRADWTMTAYGADVAAVLDDLDLRGAILVGHSMGGDVIVETALIAPERVAALVWVDVYTRLGEPATAAQLDASTAPFKDEFAARAERLVRGFFPPTADPAVVDWIARDMAAAPPEVGYRAIRHALANEPRVLDVLPTLALPRVAINADYRPTDEASLATYGFRTVLLDRVGHFPMLEDPVQLNRVLGAVIDGLR